jgi:hypothetical protein
VCNSLGVSLKHVYRVDGGVSEVPQTEGGVSGRGDHQTLAWMGTAVGQLLVVAWTHTYSIKDLGPCKTVLNMTVL